MVLEAGPGAKERIQIFITPFFSLGGPPGGGGGPRCVGRPPRRGGGPKLRKYNRSGEVRKEKAETRRSLGEVLKEHRVRCKMTQEFVAESLGVSRQAVSKWETGVSHS